MHTLRLLPITNLLIYPLDNALSPLPPPFFTVLTSISPLPPYPSITLTPLPLYHPYPHQADPSPAVPEGRTLRDRNAR